MKKKTYSKDIANAVCTVLKEDNWHFSFDDQRGVFRFGLSMKGKIKEINYIIYVKENDYTVYVGSPLGADEGDEKMMATMAEFVCRVNYGLKYGNFELDMRDGEVRFKSFVDCEGAIPTKEIVRNSVFCPAAMLEQYGEGIADIIFRNINAEDAVEKCERAPAEGLQDLPGSASDTDMMSSGLLEQFDMEEDELSSKGVTAIRTDLFGTKGGNS